MKKEKNEERLKNNKFYKLKKLKKAKENNFYEIWTKIFKTLKPSKTKTSKKWS